jgi:hypothetical protein
MLPHICLFISHIALAHQTKCHFPIL